MTNREPSPPDGDFVIILQNGLTAEIWWVANYLRNLPSGAGWTDGDRSGYFCAYMFLQHEGKIVGRVTFTRVPVPRDQGGAYAYIKDEDMLEGQRFYDGTPAPAGSNELGDCPPPSEKYEPYFGPDQRPTIRYQLKDGTVLETRDYKKTVASPAVKFRQVLSTPSRVTVLAVVEGLATIAIYYDSISPEVVMTSDIGTSTPVLPGGLIQDDVVAWYAARITPGAAVDAKVPALIDVSGNGRNIPQPIVAKQFTHRANIFGTHPAWEANLSIYKRQWGFAVLEPYTIFGVVDVTGPQTVDYGIWSGYNTTNKHLTALRAGGRWIIEQSGTGTHVMAGRMHVAVTGTRYVLRTDYGITDRTKVNGVQVLSGDAGHDPSIGVTLAARETDQRHLVGHIAEWGLVTNPSKADAVETELITIYGG